MRHAGKVKWYASGGGIARWGPFDTQMEAYQKMRLTQDARERQRLAKGPDMPYPKDIVVWPETGPETKD